MSIPDVIQWLELGSPQFILQRGSPDKLFRYPTIFGANFLHFFIFLQFSIFKWPGKNSSFSKNIHCLFLDRHGSDGVKKWQEFANVFQIFQEGLAKFPSPGQIIGPKRQEWMSWQWKCWRIPKVVKVTILQRKLSSIYIFSNHLWKRSANSAHDSCAKSIYKNLLEYMWYKDDTKDFMDLFFSYSPWLSWSLCVNVGK